MAAVFVEEGKVGRHLDGSTAIVYKWIFIQRRSLYMQPSGLQIVRKIHLLAHCS